MCPCCLNTGAEHTHTHTPEHPPIHMQREVCELAQTLYDKVINPPRVKSLYENKCYFQFEDDSLFKLLVLDECVVQVCSTQTGSDRFNNPFDGIFFD